MPAERNTHYYKILVPLKTPRLTSTLHNRNFKEHFTMGQPFKTKVPHMFWLQFSSPILFNEKRQGILRLDVHVFKSLIP